MNNPTEGLDFKSYFDEEENLILEWNPDHPLAVEHFNNWSVDEWIDRLGTEANRVIRIYGDEPIDLW